ncbi:hypothetical protein ACSF85_02480 [Moraxella bovoculi]|uniref:hypothetical protein n=1 Tax=Moraxella bovoculi TaxID=386891 RepID=UPI003F506DAC
MWIKNTLPFLTLATITTVANATPIDWTPYLKEMQNSCDFRAIETMFKPTYNEITLKPSYPRLPKSLRSSISSISQYGDLNLKNAVAFGHPIKKISPPLAVGDGSGITIEFANTKFFDLLPTFTLSDGRKTEKAGTKHYWVNEVEYQYFYSDDNLENFDFESEDPIDFRVEEKILATHVLPYKIGADREIHTAFNLENRLAYQDQSSNEYQIEDYFSAETIEIKNKLNKRGFYQHQGDLLKKIVKTNLSYTDSDSESSSSYRIDTYMTNPTGYEMLLGNSSVSLVFNKKAKTITCSEYNTEGGGIDLLND